jgi:ATP-dependent helicase HrpB
LGLARIARFDPDRGLEELRKERIGRFSADQRSGRAGRTAPGRCIRLWSRLEDQRLAPSVESELARSDLAPLCLQLRLWYGDDARTFPWFEAPEAGRLDAAEQLLQALGFIESAYGPLTARGRYLAKLPLHPRLSRLLLEAEQAGALGLGAAIAACLGERDLRQRSAPRPSRARVADVEDDLFLLHEGPRHPSVHRGAWHEVDRVRKDLLRRWGSRSSEGPWYTPDDFEELLPRLVLAAYPDRVSRRSAPGSNRIQILGGVAAELDEGSCCQVRPGQRDTGDLVLAVSLRGLTGAKGKRVRCDSASSLDEALLEAVHPGALTDAVEHRFDASRGRVSANRVRRFGSLALAMSPCPPEPYAAAELLADALHKDWPGALRRRPAVAQLLDRWLWLRQRRPELDLPNPVDPELVLPQWCHGHIALDSLPDPSPQLTGGLSWEQSQALDRLAPKELTLPNGRHCPLAYPEVNEAPTLSLRIQDCFGWPDGPRIDDGRCPVRLELLAPNGRPQQITEDLAGFWAGSYALVRKDLRGRYPKHPWPENPAEAEPVLRRRRGGTKGKS